MRQSGGVVVEEAREASPELLAAVNRLLRQLSSRAPQVSESELVEIVDSVNTRLFVARRDEAVLGMTTLVLVRIPSGVRAIIEDVVVDEAGRGQGIGRRLVLTALEAARGAGVASVDLTSRPSRTAAHRLYRSVGFEPRDTTVYRYHVDVEGPVASAKPHAEGGNEE